MKQVPVMFVYDDYVKSLNKENFKIRYVQVRKKATFSDLKKRITDCAN